MFRVELAFVEQRTREQDKNWIAATHDRLRNVKRYLENEDIEGDWFSPHATLRNLVFGLSLRFKQRVLREEAQNVSWDGVMGTHQFFLRRKTGLTEDVMLSGLPAGVGSRCQFYAAAPTRWYEDAGGYADPSVGSGQS